MKRVGKIILGVILAIVLLMAVGILYLTLTEYKPEAVEELEISNPVEKEISLEDGLSVVIYNMGYGANDKNSDFFMDGGTGVLGESKETVQANMEGNLQMLGTLGADIFMLQEVDRDAKRSYGINEVEILGEEFKETMSETYATNYLCKYIPYPFPVTLGRVNSGLVTLNSYQTAEAKRYRLPCPFSWPLRLGQLKRGLLVQRMPIADSDKEVVMVNVHLEAYDSGEGKIEQTKVLTELLLSEYEKGNYVIAGGDFNQCLPGVDMEKYPIVDKSYFVPGQVEKDILPEGWSYAVDNEVPSARLLNEPYDPADEKTQYYILDGFIISPNVSVKKVSNIDAGFAYSDHNPVYLEVEFKNES